MISKKECKILEEIRDDLKNMRQDIKTARTVNLLPIRSKSLGVNRAIGNLALALRRNTMIQENLEKLQKYCE